MLRPTGLHDAEGRECEIDTATALGMDEWYSLCLTHGRPFKECVRDMLGRLRERIVKAEESHPEWGLRPPEPAP